MNFLLSFFKQSIPLLLSSIIFLSFNLFPSVALAKDTNGSTSISDLSETFSEKFCSAVSRGLEPEQAGETAAKEIVRGLIFSPILKEVLAIPPEELAKSLSGNIFNDCGDNLGISEQGLYDYLIVFANRDREASQPKPFKPFGVG